MWWYYTIFLIVLFFYWRHTKIKEHRIYIRDLKHKRNRFLEDDNIVKDGYSKKKIDFKYDAIIIGSGIGSLSTAACLAKFGKKVLVLEKHYIVGGCYHAFKEGGYEFDTGINYIGTDIMKDRFLKNITNYDIDWEPLGCDAYTYDKIFMGGIHLEFSADVEKSITNLCEIFPKEESVIRKYFLLIRKVSRFSNFMKFKVIKGRWLRKILAYFFCKEYYYYASRTTYEVLLELTENEKLISALCSQFGDLGLVPQKSSFFAHAGVVNHYLKGAVYPKGGSMNIVKSLVETIYKYGGRVLVRRGVKRILLRESQVYGVLMENDNEIYSDMVISGVGYKNTYQKLLPSKVLLSHGVTETLLSISPSNSFLIIFLGIRGNHDILRLPKYNICDWSDFTFEKLEKDLRYKPFEATASGYISFPCTRDSSWKQRFPGKSNAILISPISYQLFKKCNNTQMGKRGEDYNDFKRVLGIKMVKELFLKHFPELEDNIETLEVGSPLTNQYYLNSSYGLEHTPERFVSPHLSPYTPYEGLYLTGQDICSAGFAGALNGGLICSYAVLGYGNILSLVQGKDLISDLKFLNK